MNIAGIEIGSGEPCRFVAEISCNHNGSVALAEKLVIAAARIGADFVKFQAYTPDELIALRGDGPAPDPWGTDGWSMRQLYEKARTPREWFPNLFALARGWGIVPFASVFGAESLAAMEAIGCPAYKIASFERDAHGLYAAVRATRKPILISRPDEPPTPDDAAVGYLYCPPGYPTPTDHLKLPYDFDFAGFVGLSSHCLDRRLPIVAVARHCHLIEMHLQGGLWNGDDDRSALESAVSLTAMEFADMIRDVRAAEELIS